MIFNKQNTTQLIDLQFFKFTLKCKGTANKIQNFNKFDSTFVPEQNEKTTITNSKINYYEIKKRYLRNCNIRIFSNILYPTINR